MDTPYASSDIVPVLVPKDYVVEAQRVLIVGTHFIDKYQQRAADAGTHAAALQLRKQGVPFDVARLILLGR